MEKPQFISPDLWLPKSPINNLVDGHIWAWMQEPVYTKTDCNSNALKQRLIDMWAKLLHSIRDEVHT